LVGDLYFDDQIVCALTQEQGFEAMQIEVHAPLRGGSCTFRLADFEAVLEALKRRMFELRRSDS
jgi:hypothetical protein